MHFLGKLGINLFFSHPSSTRVKKAALQSHDSERKLKVDQEIPSSALLFHLSTSFCFSLYKWPPSSALRSWQLLGGWPRFLPLKVLWVQSHPSQEAGFWNTLDCAIVCFFSLSPLGLLSQINRNLGLLSEGTRLIGNARKLFSGLLIWLKRRNLYYL